MGSSNSLGDRDSLGGSDSLGSRPGDGLRVLMITSEWPTPEKPYQVPFIVQQANFLRRAGVDVEVFPFRGGKRPVRYARAWRKAQAKIAQGRYDLVHAQWGQSGLLALPRRIPLVVTFRGDDLEGIIGEDGRQTTQGVVLKNLSRLVARAADQVILVSPSLARGIPQRPYNVIPSGLDLRLFCPASKEEARQKLGLDPQRRYVLFAGAAGNPRKRFGLARQAVELLKAELDVELLVADRVAHEQIPVYMNASDALLLVSLHEGSPNVVKEALACNLPVVSTNVGDVRQRIGAIAGCAVLKDDGDSPEAIAAALGGVLRRGEPILGRAAVEDLDETLLTEKVLNVYQLALTG
jgi:teichuronic acid biosynthesis glycosyltransferase TuaC